MAPLTSRLIGLDIGEVNVRSVSELTPCIVSVVRTRLPTIIRIL